jgi:uncharacterized protein (TIGR02757 family)
MPGARINNNVYGLPLADLRNYLEAKYNFYNCPEFIHGDPVSVPHKFIRKEDIEIAGFLTATISWGNRSTIIKNASVLMRYMDNSPYQFITGASNTEMKPLKTFVHRTFNGEDAEFFIRSLNNIYQKHGGLEQVFKNGMMIGRSLKESMDYFRQVFFELPHLPGTRKHLSSPALKSASKRMNMFLRWMVRKDDRGVDFGIWNAIKPSDLYCPLDVHTGVQSRRLGLLIRRQNDWKAVEELTFNLRLLDPIDPVKYDFALFGSGIHEK